MQQQGTDHEQDQGQTEDGPVKQTKDDKGQDEEPAVDPEPQNRWACGDDDDDFCLPDEEDLPFENLETLEEFLNKK